MLFKRFRSKEKNRQRRRGGGMGPSIVTADVVIDGSFVSGGDLQVDGTINGDVRARSVVIDFNGIVHGEVMGEEIVVRGRVIGQIRGVHVHILSGGHVEGDVLNETISIDHGAYVDGKIHRVDDPLQADVAADETEEVLSLRSRRPAGEEDDLAYPQLEFGRRPKAAE